MHSITGYGKNVTAIDAVNGITDLEVSVSAKDYVELCIAMVMDIVTRCLGGDKAVFLKNGFILRTDFGCKLVIHITFPKKT